MASMRVSVISETTDQDMMKLANDDIARSEDTMRELDDKLVAMIIGSNPEDASTGVIMELSPGAGGQEAMLFTSDILNMYQGFADFQQWKFSILDLQDSPQGTVLMPTVLTQHVFGVCIFDVGGIRHASASVSGPNVYQLLKFEAGIHRVQRVPATERTGRMHTSTTSVVLMPEPPDV